MHVIDLPSIFIPDNRQRREFDPGAINELANSIRTRGLLHPVVVAPDGDKYRLVAGERRIRAISSLAELDISFTCGTEVIPAGFTAVTLLDELDPLTLREIELEENTIRVDLSWQELARARADLDALRRARNPSHTVADTAREVFGEAGGTRNMAIREAIILTDHLDDPEISAAASQKEAIKILVKKKEREHRQKLAETVNIQTSQHILLEGDFYANISRVADNSIDTILTDPPYGIGADSFGDQAEFRHNYSDSPRDTKELLAHLARESFRVARPLAHAYCFCSIELFPELSTVWREAGWSVWVRPLIWYKGNFGFLPRPDHGPRYTYEAILFAIKGDKKTVKPGHDVIVGCQLTEDRIHAAQKPLSLYLELLSRSCLPGDSVLDPFAGSGTIFRAAKGMKLIATGIEKDPEQIANCKLAIGGGNAD